MSKVDAYRAALRERKSWRPYLLEHSGLPGPRGNLELAKAVAAEDDEALFREQRLARMDERWVERIRRRLERP